jgi:hypothetical protein
MLQVYIERSSSCRHGAVVAVKDFSFKKCEGLTHPMSADVVDKIAQVFML